MSSFRRHLPLDDRIDAAARDGTQMVPARLVTVGVHLILLAINFGTAISLAWAAATLVFELGRGIAARRIAIAGGSQRSRGFYLLSVAGMSTAWTTLPIIFWLSNLPALQIFAMVLLSNQLIHALAFTFRSPAVLAIATILPAAAMITLPTCFGQFSGAELATIGCGIALTLFYVTAAIRTNRAADAALRESQDELERFAYFDALTSLANRRRFTDNLRQLIALSRRRGSRFALLLLDLDKLKVVNDTLGHDAGDALLIEIAARLQRAVRDSDHVARLGGDEFAILLPDAGNVDATRAVYERIAASVADPIAINGTAIRSSLSVGVAVYPDDADAAERLYKAADLALYAAKRGGRDTWRFSGQLVD